MGDRKCSSSKLETQGFELFLRRRILPDKTCPRKFIFWKCPQEFAHFEKKSPLEFTDHENSPALYDSVMELNLVLWIYLAKKPYRYFVWQKYNQNVPGAPLSTAVLSLPLHSGGKWGITSEWLMSFKLKEPQRSVFLMELVDYETFHTSILFDKNITITSPVHR